MLSPKNFYRFLLTFSTFFTTTTMIFLASCAGSKPGTGYVDNIPKEISKVIEKKYQHGVYAIGTAEGATEHLAEQKATIHARAELARQFKANIDVLQKKYTESVNEQPADEFTEVTELFATLEVQGSHVAKSMIRKEKKNRFTAKVLVVISAEKLQQLLQEKMQAYTSFKASKAYEELENRVALEKKKG